MNHKISVGAAWTEADAVIRRERRLLAPIVLGLIALPSILTAMVTPDMAPGTMAPPGWWMVAVFAFIVLSVVGQMAIMLLVNGWRGSVGEAMSRSMRRLPTLILASLVLMAPLFLVVSVMSAAGGTAAAPKQMSGGVALLMLVLMGLMLFVAIRLLPMLAFAVTGDEGPIALLRRTWNATRSNFWRLAGFLLLFAIAFTIASLAASAVFGTLLILLLGRPEPWSVSMLLMAAAIGLIQALFVTLYAAMLARFAVQLEGGPSTSGM